MSHLKTVMFIANIAILFPLLLFSQSLDHLTLLAHYPLLNSANDTTGNYNPMILNNTPFQDGGIYCNGNYDNPDICWAFTPYIDELSSREFAVSAEFKVMEYYNERKPVFVCGNSWRWQFVFLNIDSTIGFYKSGDFFTTNSTKIKYTLDEWHTTVLTYDSLSSVVRLYFDGVAIDSVISSLDMHDERQINISHNGVGKTFKGILRNLKIYSTAEETHVSSDKINQQETYILAQNYPNPFNPTTAISYQLPARQKDGESSTHPKDGESSTFSHVQLKIYNVQGQEIRTLVDECQSAGSKSVVWDGLDNLGKKVTSGLYFYHISVGDFSAAKKMMLIQ